MNNRNANRENTYPNLSAWCKKYHEESGIKIHPSSVPTDLVLEDVIGYISMLVHHDKDLVSAFDHLSKRVADLELLVHQLASQFTEVARFMSEKVENEELQPMEIKPTTKKVKK